LAASVPAIKHPSRAYDRFVNRPAFVSAHDCDVVAGVANATIQQELSSMLGNELTHRLYETLRWTNMTAYGTNISLNDAQAYMQSRPLSHFNFISPSLLSKTQ
jgi:hypothetical protein